MNDIITVKCNNGKAFEMKKLEYARWLCLIEAIDLIERKAQDLKADLITDDFWVKPLAFQKYIDQRLETMIIDVDREEFNMSTVESIKANKNIIPIAVEEEASTDVEEDIEPSEEELSVFNSVS